MELRGVYRSRGGGSVGGGFGLIRVRFVFGGFVSLFVVGGLLFFVGVFFIGRGRYGFLLRDFRF